MNLYLFKKYWSKHKGRLFSLILAIVLLTGTAVFSVLNERTELRRQLHDMYNTYGNYGVVIHNVTDEQYEQIRELPYTENLCKISAVGTIDIAGKNYTIGSFEDEKAEIYYHTPLIKGQLPKQSGQIAMPEFILNQLYPNADIGDTISVDFTDLNGNVSDVSYELSGIIGNTMNRFDMEYSGNSDGLTITSKETAYPTPSIYIYSGDTNGLTKYSNYLFVCDEESYFSERYDDTYRKTLDSLYEITDKISSGKQYFILLNVASEDMQPDGFLKAQTSDNIMIIHILTFLMMIISAIALISGVIAIMPKRIDSLRLLRSVGMSKRKLLSIFITEFLIFWIIGNILGIGLGCGVHELIIFLQQKVGISVYRGYIVEYVVAQKTISPFIMPLVLSLVISAISIIVPVKNIIQMKFYKKQGKKKSRSKVNSLNRAFSKMTGTRFLSVLSCVSMIIAICATTFGYCYYTESGKGTTYFSIGEENTEDAYFKVNGINIKENDIDCTVTANIPNGNEIAVYDKEYGITDSELKNLGSSADLLSWGLYPAFTVVYGENMEAPQKLLTSTVPFNDTWEYYDEFKENTIYDVGLVFINDAMMKMLCDAQPDDVILISQNGTFAYEIGDIVPMISCLCDDNKHVQLDTMKHFDVEITKQLNLMESGVEENDILKNCGMFNFTSSYTIAMTAETAEKLGFYYPAYSSVMMKFNSDMSDEEMKNYVSSSVDKPVRTNTIHELEHKAKLNKLASNVNSIVLFVLLFILCLVTVWNLLQMNAQNNINKFSTMHSIGLPMKKIKKMFVVNMMKSALIAVISGTAVSLAGKALLTSKFNEYMKLLVKQQKMGGNDGYPDVIIGYSTAYMEKADELYGITEKLEHLKSTFMLEREMWLPKLLVPLCIIGAVIILSTLICSLMSAKKIKDERSLNDD